MLSEKLLFFTEDVVILKACRNGWTERYVAYMFASRANGTSLGLTERVAGFFLRAGFF